MAQAALRIDLQRRLCIPCSLKRGKAIQEHERLIKEVLCFLNIRAAAKTKSATLLEKANTVCTHKRLGLTASSLDIHHKSGQKDREEIDASEVEAMLLSHKQVPA